MFFECLIWVFVEFLVNWISFKICVGGKRQINFVFYVRLSEIVLSHVFVLSQLSNFKQTFGRLFLGYVESDKTKKLKSHGKLLDTIG